jgi:hypothetical protein
MSEDKIMEFEYIDESEIVTSRSEKTKKTPSLFDSRIEDRTYWGNDPGTEIVMALARMQIRKSIKDLKLFDVDNEELSCLLLREYRDELRLYQIEMIKALITQDIVKVVYDSNNCEWVLEIVPHISLLDN